MRHSPSPRGLARAAVVAAVGAAAAIGPAAADTGLGSLSCDRIPGTTSNFIVTSKAEVRCIFKGQGDAEQWYVGESGIALGLDLKWTETENISFAVLSTTREFTPEGDFLSGNYSGGKADVAAGVGVGAAVLIGGSEDTTALQPAVTTGQGVGVSAGIGYLTIKPDPLNMARIATPRGDVFTQALYSTYFTVALEEYRSQRYPQSDHLAGKSLAAARGERPAADRTQGRDLPGDTLAELTAARERVDAVQRHEFAASAIGETAAVQAYFDCWLGAEVAPADKERARVCKEYFDTQMSTLERHLSEQTAAAQMEQKLMEPRWWTVYFDTDVHALDAAGEATATEVAATFRNYKEARVYVWGHTDAVGSAQYNVQLSKERANSVQAALVRAGVPLEWIRPVGYGKRNPVKFSTNPYDATNRRVDIVVEPLSVKLN